jgi:hypothetical protein
MTEHETSQPADAGPLERTVRQHTPGPWAWRGTLGPSNAEYLKGPCVVEVGATGAQLAALSGWRTDRQKADAALMAAAPDLLSALEAVLACVTDETYEPTRDRARAAIARAVGRAA